MIGSIILIVSAALFVLYALRMKKEKLTTKIMVVIAMIGAISYILNMIEFIKYPQGGGISLFSMMPVMVLSLLYGVNVGVTGGIIFAFLKLLGGASMIHPAQFLLDYIIPNMALGLAGIFGMNKKINMIMGCLLAVSISALSYVLSGGIYFAQYAPENMNPWLYSLVYNFSSAGVEGILTTILIVFAPIKRVAKSLNISVDKGNLATNNKENKTIEDVKA